MLPQGHLAGGFLVSQAVTHLMGLSGAERWGMVAIGTMAGATPDADALLYFAKKRSLRIGEDFKHHAWVTHTLPFHWAIAVFLHMLGLYLGNLFLSRAAILYAATATCHLLMDVLGSGDGIMLAWPFSKRFMGIGTLHVHGKNWLRLYRKSPVFRVERCIRYAALLVLLFQLAALFLGFTAER